MRQLREAVDDAFGNTVREVIGVWITVLIVKRQHRDRFCRQLSALFRTCVTTEKKDAHRDRAGYDHDVNPCAITRCFFRQFVRKLRSLQSFRRQLKGPRKHERNGKTYHNQHYHQPDCPVWNLEKRENLRRYLHQQPCDDCIGDRNFVNVAAPQLGEEITHIHGFFSSQSFWKRGSLRIWSKSGSSRSRAGVNGGPPSEEYGMFSKCFKAGIARLPSPKRACIRARIASYCGPARASFADGRSSTAWSASRRADSRSPRPASVLASKETRNRLCGYCFSSFSSPSRAWVKLVRASLMFPESRSSSPNQR